VSQAGTGWRLKGPEVYLPRTIALDPLVMELLAARRSRAGANANRAGLTLPETAFVCSTQPDGSTPRTPENVSRAVKRFCWRVEEKAKALGCAEHWQLRFKDLHHLSATDMPATGLAPGMIANRLGPADPSPPGLPLQHVAPGPASVRVQSTMNRHI
jgi:integrase